MGTPWLRKLEEPSHKYHSKSGYRAIRGARCDNLVGSLDGTQQSQGSDRFHRNGKQIVHQSDFLLQKRFGIGHAAEHAVIPRHRVHARANLVVSREEILACFLIAELRLVSQDGGEFLLELPADVNHKRRTTIVIERGVDDFEGPVWSKFRSAGILARVQSAKCLLRVQLRQSRQKASLVSQ